MFDQTPSYYLPRHTALKTSEKHAAAQLGAVRDYEALRRGYTYQPRHSSNTIRVAA